MKWATILKGCDVVYDAGGASSVGYIKSPGFPQPYPHDLDCHYYIVADERIAENMTILFMRSWANVRMGSMVIKK